MNVFNRLKSNSNASLKLPETGLVEKFGPVIHEPKLTPTNEYTPVQQASLTSEQKDKLEKLRNYIESIMLPKDHEYYPNEKGFITEATLKRYMRARKWDYEVCDDELAG